MPFAFGINEERVVGRCLEGTALVHEFELAYNSLVFAGSRHQLRLSPDFPSAIWVTLLDILRDLVAVFVGDDAEVDDVARLVLSSVHSRAMQGHVIQQAFADEKPIVLERRLISGLSHGGAFEG